MYFVSQYCTVHQCSKLSQYCSTAEYSDALVAQYCSTAALHRGLQSWKILVQVVCLAVLFTFFPNQRHLLTY